MTPNIIFLIISSNDVPEYKYMRDIIDLYYKKFRATHNLKHFFLELNEDIDIDILLT